jgi:hypothetical protein
MRFLIIWSAMWLFGGLNAIAALHPHDALKLVGAL